MLKEIIETVLNEEKETLLEVLRGLEFEEAYAYVGIDEKSKKCYVSYVNNLALKKYRNYQSLEDFIKKNNVEKGFYFVIDGIEEVYPKTMSEDDMYNFIEKEKVKYEIL